MAVTLRLMRFGKKGEALYRVVALDKRKKRDGKYLDNVGTYNPQTTPASLEINQKKLQDWLKKGAEVSEGLQRILKNRKTSC